MPDPLEAILFDLNGTLRRTTRREEYEKVEKAHRIQDMLGSTQDPREFTQTLAGRAEAFKRWAKETLLGISEEQLWVKWMLPDWPAEVVRPQASQFNLIWRDAIGVRTFLPDVKETITALHRRGYRLGLVSNTTSSSEVHQALAKLGILGYIETIVLSCEFGKRKPDPAMLLAAAGNLGVPPGRCTYVGNRPEFDVTSSRTAGFGRTIIMRNGNINDNPEGEAELKPDLLIGELRELLVEFPGINQGKSGVKRLGKPTYAASISTMWGVKLFPTLTDFVEAARRMGFSQVELNHQVDSGMLADLDFEPGTVSSVHEPCPADISVDALKKRDWLISALDEGNRQQGVAATKRSIDLAHKLGAKVVVVHCGHMPNYRAIEDQVRDMVQPGESQSAAYLARKENLLVSRAETFGAGFESVKKSVRELVKYADQYGICLGLENRFHYMEYPSPDELAELFEMGNPDQIGFVYDVGHAQALDRLGFYGWDAWLVRYSRRMVEVHLHDLIGIRDHLAPGLGEMDFVRVAGYIPDNALRTVEVNHRNNIDQLRTGLRLLAESGCIHLI